MDRTEQLRLLRKSSVYVVLAVVFAALGYGITRSVNVSLVVIGGLVLIFALVRPYAGTILLILSGFSVDWLLAAGVLPSYSALLQDGLALALVVAVIFHLVRAERPVSVPSGSRWLLAFVVLAVLGAFVAGSDPVAGTLSLRAILRFVPLLFLPMVLRWTERQTRGLVLLIIGLTLVQVPVAAVQFLLRSGKSGDPVGGTLGAFSSGALTVLVIAMVMLLVGMYIYRAASGPVVLVAIVAMCIPPALNETKVFFVAAPILWAVVIAPRLRRNFVAVALVAAALIAGVAMAFQSYAVFYGPRLSTTSGFEATLLTQAQSDPAKEGVMRRLPQVGFAIDTVDKDARTIVFGFGAGALTRSDLAGVTGALQDQFGQLVRNTVFGARLLLEYGYVGLVCFAGLLVAVYLSGRRLEKRDLDGFWKACGMGLQGMVLTFAVMTVYTSPFTSDALSASLWTLAGVCAWRLATLPEPTTEVAS